jgi:methionyl-tRNA formyltransferase
MVRVIFFGTAEVASPFLQDLLKHETVVAVVAQPDRPAERGQKLRKPPVKVIAEENNIPVFQPERFAPELVEQLKALSPDAGVVVSYGRLIPENVFTLPKQKSFNIHFSLLPRYRGAAPIQRALIRGEKETGVTTFWLEKTLDTGKIIVQKRLPVEANDDAITLKEKLIGLGIEAMNETLKKMEAGAAAGTPQEGEPSYAPALKKEDGAIDWTKPAGEIIDLIRGTRPWPGAYTGIKGKRLKILKASVVSEDPCCAGVQRPGRVAALIKGKGFIVACGKECLVVEEVQPESRKAMPAWDFLQGGHLAVGEALG